MIKLKTFDDILEVVLTVEEKNDRAAKMSGTVIERRRLKEEAKRQAESFNSKIKLLDQEIEAEAVVIENGIEWRKVLCAERINESGIEVEIVRTDTGEIVRTRAMTEEERQQNLFVEPEPMADRADADDQALAENMANAATFLKASAFLSSTEQGEKEEVEADAVQDPCICGHDYVQHFRNDVQCDECNCSGFTESEEQRAAGDEFPGYSEWLSGLNEDERQKWHGAPCKCGHWRGLHEEGGNGRCPAIAPGCPCKAYRCAECDTKGGHQGDCSHYVTNEGTPIETELPADEIERIADLSNTSEMDKIDKGSPLKIAHINGNPYIVNGWASAGHNKGRDRVWAYPVLPISIVGEENTRTREQAYEEMNRGGFSSSPMSYRNVKFNGGSKKNPDWWVIVGDQVTFTVRPDVIPDDFTASRCDECGRIEGGHDPQCAHASKFTYKTYLEFATAQNLENPASHARKMELSRERDDEVRAWLESQQGAPADGSLFDAIAEPKPKRRSKPQAPTSYAEGL